MSNPTTRKTKTKTKTKTTRAPLLVGVRSALDEADGLEAFTNDEAVALDKGLLEIFAHEVDGQGVAQALPQSGLVEVVEAGVDVAGEVPP